MGIKRGMIWFIAISLVFLWNCSSLAWDTTQNENILAFDASGEILGSYHKDDWTVQVTGTLPTPTIHSVQFSPGTFATTPFSQGFSLSSTVSAVVPNELSGTLPALPALPIPPVSLYSFDPAIFESDSSSNPGVSISPSPGTYDHTLAVQMKAYPSSAMLRYRDLGDSTWINAGNEKVIYIHQNRTLEIQARRFFWFSKVITAEYIIIQDPKVDSDKDGFPDDWEIAKGLNPLQSDTRLDSDGDGIRDIDEILRGSDPYSDAATTQDNDCDGWTDFDEMSYGTDPNDPADKPAVGTHSTPLDSDCDGWSDVDERLRGTDPNDPDSKPAARSLYEVELIVSGRFFTDPSQTSPLPAPASLRIGDLAGGILVADDIHLDGSYGPHRIPAGRPGLIGVWGSPHDNFVLKRYLPSFQDPSPEDMTATWTDPNEWESAFMDYLADGLVKEILDFDINPLHIAPLALAERELEYIEDLPEGIFVILGNPPYNPTALTLTQWEEILLVRGERLNDQMESLDEILIQPCNSLLSDVQILYDAVSIWDEDTVEMQVAQLFQEVRGRYLAILLLIYRYDELQSLPYPLCELLDPWGDPDEDGLSSAYEILLATPLSPAPFRYKSVLWKDPRFTYITPGMSDPFAFDTDGDNIPDGMDNCPFVENQGQEDNDLDGTGDVCDMDDDNDGCSDGVENILNGTLETFACEDGDTDGDGICNSIDNCMSVKNPKQINTDSDAYGDACETDDDNDGLPDEFERDASTSIFLKDSDEDGIPDPQEDPDDDDFTNLQEFIAGTDPLDPNSIPAMSFEMNLPSGWNMISLPVEPLNPIVSALFPYAETVYSYEEGTGYIHVHGNEELEVEKGYWIRLYQDQNYVTAGQPFSSYADTVYEDGWRMVGGCSSDAIVSTDDCMINAIYKYVPGKGYQRVLASGFLEPGYGYWVLFRDVLGQCQFRVEAIGSL